MVPRRQPAPVAPLLAATSRCSSRQVRGHPDAGVRAAGGAPHELTRDAGRATRGAVPAATPAGRSSTVRWRRAAARAGRAGSPGTGRSRRRAAPRAARRSRRPRRRPRGRARGPARARPRTSAGPFGLAVSEVGEAAVELDAVGGQLLQPGERREAGAEVVEGDADPEASAGRRAARRRRAGRPARGSRPPRARAGRAPGRCAPSASSTAARSRGSTRLRPDRLTATRCGRRAAALVPGAERAGRLGEHPEVELDDQAAVLGGRHEGTG